jgi:hypothetical protein
MLLHGNGRFLHYLSFGLLLAAALTSCTSAPLPRSASFNPSEYAPFEGKGDAVISGQVSHKTEDGFVTSGGGCREVMLEPATSYSAEWYEREILKNQHLAPSDPRALTYRRTVPTDSNGFFQFDHVHEGSYYLACLMHWDRWVMLGTRPTMFEEEAWVHGQITVKPGEHGRVVLSH